MRVGSGSVPSCVHVARVYRFVSLVLDATFCRPVLGFVCDPGRHLGGVPCFFRPCLLCPRLAFVRGPQFLPHSPDSLSSACPRRPPNACSTTRKANKHTTMPETCHMRCNAVCGASCGSRFAVVSYRHTAGLANGRASSLFFFPDVRRRPSVCPSARSPDRPYRATTTTAGDADEAVVEGARLPVPRAALRRRRWRGRCKRGGGTGTGTGSQP